MTQELKNIDADEIARFSAQADEWWDLAGEYKALHQINPVRLDYVRERAGLAGKKVLDIGCGGGLLSETMAGAGAHVTGIDMAAPSLAVAKAHAQRGGLNIDYRQSTAEDWARGHSGAYDVVTAWSWWSMFPIRGGSCIPAPSLCDRTATSFLKR